MYLDYLPTHCYQVRTEYSSELIPWSALDAHLLRGRARFPFHVQVNECGIRIYSIVCEPGVCKM